MKLMQLLIVTNYLKYLLWFISNESCKESCIGFRF